MTTTIVPREIARRDVQDAIDTYLTTAGEKVALAFIDEIERSYRILAEQPGIGSLRYAYELSLPDLRALQLRRFPYLVFYRHLENRIDVWRVLHAKRDIPAWLGEP